MGFLDRRRGAFVLFLVGLLVPFSSASAQTTSGIEMSVIAGYENRYLPLSPLPVSVLIESTRAVSGTLSVSSIRGNGGSAEHSMDIEVPAGGRKQFDLLGTPAAEIQIDFRDPDGKRLKTVKQNLQPVDETLVGVVVQPVPASLEAAAAAAKEHPMRAMSIRRSWLRFGAQALRPLSYLILDQDTSSALTPVEIRSVVDWTASGGRLLLAGSGLDRFPWLPETWKAALESGSGPADSGRVRVLGRPLIATEADQAVWDGSIRPYPLAAALDQEAAHQSESSDGELAGLLTRDEAGGLQFGWLIGFLVIYLAVVGPINYLVLRNRGRKELLWITIPALALAFSAVGWGLSRGSRDELVLKQANVIFATAEGSIGRRIAVVATARETTKTITMDGSHLLLINPPIEYGPTGPVVRPGDGPVSLMRGSESEMTLRTDPFSGRVLSASPPSSVGYLDAELAWDGRGFFGRVTNRTKFKMTQVVLMMGLESTEIGPLGPGKSADLSFVPPIPGERPVPSHLLSPNDVHYGGYQSGPRFGGYHQGSYPPAQRSSGAIPALIGVHDRMLGFVRPLGIPVVVGLTSDLRPGLEIDGSSMSPRGDSLIASPVRFSAAPGVRGPYPTVASRTLGPKRSTPGHHGMAYGLGALVLSAHNEYVFSASLPAGLDRARVSGVSLRVGTDSQGGYPMQVPPPPPAPGTPPQAAQPQQQPVQTAPTPEFLIEVYDWSAASWVPFKTQVGAATHALPVGALTEEGDVMVRFSSQLGYEISLWDLGLQAELG